jgi:hypothetical protein
MRLVLSLGRGHRVWWTLAVARFLWAIGRHGDLVEFSEYQGDRVNGQGQLEQVTCRTWGWFMLASWAVR